MQARDKFRTINMANLLWLAFILLASLARCSKILSLRHNDNSQVNEQVSLRLRRHLTPRFQASTSQTGDEQALAQLARPANQLPANQLLQANQAPSTNNNTNNHRWQLGHQIQIHSHQHNQHHQHQLHHLGKLAASIRTSGSI